MQQLLSHVFALPVNIFILICQEYLEEYLVEIILNVVLALKVRKIYCYKTVEKLARLSIRLLF